MDLQLICPSPTQVGSFIWDEPTSEEPAGWYHRQVIQYQTDGCAMLKYNKVTTKVIHLKQAKWKFTRKNGKLYLPPHKDPPSFPLKKDKESSARKKYFLSDPQCVKTLPSFRIIRMPIKIFCLSGMKQAFPGLRN